MVKNHPIAIRSNNLIEAHYKQAYTIQELRMLLWVISEIHPHDFSPEKPYEHKSIKISAKKYADLMNISVKNIYRDAEKIATSLGSKRFTIKTANGWINLGWISSMEYKYNEGMIHVLIAPAILPYIIDLKESYTSFCLENILNISSSHAIKIYQLLTRYSWNQEKVIELDELRNILGLFDQPSYIEYRNFKRRILEISKREINEKTDLNMDYFEIKKGRKVHAIKFVINPKEKVEKSKIISTNPISKLKDELLIKKICPETLEKAKSIIRNSGARWDIYAIEEQFYDYSKKAGLPKNNDAAFLGFVRKKITCPP